MAKLQRAAHGYQLRHPQTVNKCLRFGIQIAPADDDAARLVGIFVATADGNRLLRCILPSAKSTQSCSAPIHQRKRRRINQPTNTASPLNQCNVDGELAIARLKFLGSVQRVYQPEPSRFLARLPRCFVFFRYSGAIRQKRHQGLLPKCGEQPNRHS